MKKIGILHLSDIHISATSISTIDKLVEKLIRDIEKVKEENNAGVDLVCFAGDLIGRGDKAFEDEMQIQLAEEHFIQPLLHALNLSNKEFILVPGNHEVDIRKIVKMTEVGLAAMSSLEDINDSIYNMEDEYKRRLQYFYDYMCNKYISDAKKWNLGYSLERDINGVSVGIVGIDSAWRSTGAGHIERGKMLVGEQQVGVLFENIKDTDLKICLMHHPIDWLSDLEMNNIEKRLNHFDMVLRGHVHDLDDKQICTQRYKTIYNTSGKIYPLDDYYSDHVIWIQNFTKAFPNNRFVFSVEEKFYQTYNIKELPDLGVPFKTAYVEYFGKKQVREMVTKWGSGKENFDANEMTKKIVTYCNNISFSMSPFNIAVFMTIWDVDRNFVPINEGKVMRTYLETVLDKLSSEGFQRSEYDFDVKQHFLGYLAYKMYMKDEYYFEAEEFVKVVDQYHEKFGFKKSKSKFDKIFFDKNIIYISGENVFFSNTSILEYCLAYYATVDSELYKQMTIKGNRGCFAHELSFFSGIVSDCTPLLDILNIEITETILDNMDILDEIEKLSIKMEFKTDKDSLQKAITENRQTMNEIDDLDEMAVTKEKKSPLEITKLNTVEESESFWELLEIYGNVIKNAETASKTQKKLHLDTYILGMNFQFGLMIKEFSSYLLSKSKEELPEEIRKKHPDLTDKDFNEIKEAVLDLLKISLPIGMQFYIAGNVGSPKLDIVIAELIKENADKNFTKFMLSFLYCDMGNGKIKRFLMDYINIEESKDILKLILFKLSFYYSMRYFGNEPQIDDVLLDLITEVQVKLSADNKLGAKMHKGEIKQQIKQQFETQRRQLVV